MMLSQRDSLIERLKREHSNRFKNTVAAMELRRGSTEEYHSQRAQATARAMRETGLPDFSDTPLDSGWNVELKAECSMEAQYILERELEEELRKERMAKETARLETRIRVFFSQTY
jgi:hypothetical protein